MWYDFFIIYEIPVIVVGSCVIVELVAFTLLFLLYRRVCRLEFYIKRLEANAALAERFPDLNRRPRSADLKSSLILPATGRLDRFEQLRSIGNSSSGGTTSGAAFNNFGIDGTAAALTANMTKAQSIRSKIKKTRLSWWGGSKRSQEPDEDIDANDVNYDRIYQDDVEMGIYSPDQLQALQNQQQQQLYHQQYHQHPLSTDKRRSPSRASLGDNGRYYGSQTLGAHQTEPESEPEPEVEEDDDGNHHRSPLPHLVSSPSTSASKRFKNDVDQNHLHHEDSKELDVADLDDRKATAVNPTVPTSNASVGSGQSSLSGGGASGDGNNIGVSAVTAASSESLGVATSAPPRPLRSSSQYSILNLENDDNDDDDEEAQLSAPSSGGSATSPRASAAAVAATAATGGTASPPGNKAAFTQQYENLGLEELQFEVVTMLEENSKYRTQCKLPHRMVSQRIQDALAVSSADATTDDAASTVKSCRTLLLKYSIMLAAENEKFRKKLGKTL